MCIRPSGDPWDRLVLGRTQTKHRKSKAPFLLPPSSFSPFFSFLPDIISPIGDNSITPEQEKKMKALKKKLKSIAELKDRLDAGLTLEDNQVFFLVFFFLV